MTTRLQLGSLLFETTSACNLDCRYCYNVWKAPGGPAPVRGSYKDATRALKRAFKLADIGHVTMSGGEPFLAERFAELVLMCRLAGKSVTVISNGTVAGREDWKQMLDLKVGLFELPLHSPDPAAHERMTGTPGSWSRSLGSIRTLLELGAQVVAAVVLTRHNQHQIAETLSFLEGIGVRRVMLNRFNVGGRGVELARELLPDREGLRAAYSAANSAAREGRLSITANVCTPHCLLDPKEFPAIRFANCDTDVRRRPLTLDTAGNLRFCNHSPVAMGNLFERSFEEIFASDYVARWRTAVPPRCAGCDLWARCLGGCRAAAEQTGGSVELEDPAVALSGEAGKFACRPG